MHSIIHKQLLINYLPIPHDIQEIVKEYIFLDKIKSRARENKNYLIFTINRFDYGTKYDENDAIVQISYRYEIQLQSTFCLHCGGYKTTLNYSNYFNLSHSVLCSCYHSYDFYFHAIQQINTPIQIYY